MNSTNDSRHNKTKKDNLELLLISKTKDRVFFSAPTNICLYSNYQATMEFMHRFEHAVWVNWKYVHLDFSKTEKITAAASVVLFASITRCQCCAPKNRFKSPDQIITFTLPESKSARYLFSQSGLWTAIRPGSDKKLEKLWRDWDNPYKTGNNPKEEFSQIIQQLNSRFTSIPNKLVSALQESYLNIAHHAYDFYKNPDDGSFHPFMNNRWWQFAKKGKDTTSAIIYDKGFGIHNTLRDQYSSYNACDIIRHAMQNGTSRLNISGRGMGFNNIKSPIERNESSEYLLIYSGTGQVVYKRGEIFDLKEHSAFLGGTLLEWSFGG